MKLFTYLVSVAHDGKSIETLMSWIHIRVWCTGVLWGLIYWRQKMGQERECERDIENEAEENEE